MLTVCRRGWFQEQLAPVVHDITCASKVQFKYPTSYKHALFTSLPKVHNPMDVNNDFRQISVLPQVVKVLERILLKSQCFPIHLYERQIFCDCACQYHTRLV